MIPRAIAIAKSKPLLFTNSTELLQNNLASGAPRPVVFTTLGCFQKQALICDAVSNNFLFPSELDAGCEVEEAFATPFVDILLLPKVPAERRVISSRKIANLYWDNALQMSYLGHIGVFMDQVHNVKYCSKCGEALPPRRRDQVMCLACESKRFPRLSPCAIVLVHRARREGGEEILLLQHARSPSNQWSLVAGFCDALESIETCAVREVREETGVVIKDVTLALTQPWPFPRENYEGTNLMVGCFAESADDGGGGGVVPDGEEILKAEWVRVEDVYKRELPGKASISRLLIDSFIQAYYDDDNNQGGS